MFDTAPFEEQYRWLGAHARKLVFELIEETVEDPKLSLDVFAYDFDEPDIARAAAPSWGRGCASSSTTPTQKKDTAGSKRKAEALRWCRGGG